MHAGTVKGGVVVWFFGTFEMACLKPTEIRSFAQGLAQSLHATCKRSVKLFRTALQQAHRYMEAGLLYPPRAYVCMIMHPSAPRLPCVQQWPSLSLMRA